MENSYLDEEAMNWTLPSKKTASPGRFDGKVTPCWRVGSWGAVVSPFGGAWLSRFNDSYDFAAASAAFRSALSASAISCCTGWWRRLIRTVVAVAASSAPYDRGASVAALE